MNYERSRKVKSTLLQATTAVSPQPQPHSGTIISPSIGEIKKVFDILKMALLARISGTVLHLSNNCYSILIPNGSKTKLYKKSSSKILPYKRYFYNVRFLHIGKY